MLGILLIVSACALWAVDTLIRYPLLSSGVDAFSIVFYEHCFLSVLFLIIFFKSLPQVSRINRSDLMAFFCVGGLGSALATLSFTQAFKFLNPSHVILLQKFQPVVAIIMARYILKEKTVRAFWSWAIVCIIGAFLISYHDLERVYSQPSHLNQGLDKADSFIGYLYVLFAICGWGASTVFGKKLSKSGFHNEQIMAGRFLIGFLCLLPFVPFKTNLFTHSVDVYGKVSLMILLSGLLAMYLFYQGLKRLSARTCSLAEMFFPFMAVIVNWFFLGAKLSLIQILGGGILLLGSFVIQIRRY